MSLDINLIILFLILIISMMISGVLVYLFKHDMASRAKEGFLNFREKKNREALGDIDKKIAYDAMADNLLKKGINFRMGDNFTPFDYTLMRFFVAALLGLIGLFIDPFMVVAGAVGGYFLVPFYFNHENKNDNNQMLDDIAQIYGIVSLQLKNNVHISKVIYECYLSTGYPRLKKSLLELSLEIEKFGSIKEASASFSSKFSNRYIDSFAKTLEQSDETGNAAEMFKNIGEQIEGINDAIAIREKNKVENIAFFFQTLVFVGAIVFVVYVTFGVFGEMEI